MSNFEESPETIIDKYTFLRRLSFFFGFSLVSINGEHGESQLMMAVNTNDRSVNI